MPRESQSTQSLMTMRSLPKKLENFSDKLLHSPVGVFGVCENRHTTDIEPDNVSIGFDTFSCIRKAQGGGLRI